MNNITSNNRIDYIDYTKVLCITLMVLGHCTWNRTIYQYIYSFHMPAFFIISGILYKARNWHYTLISFLIPVIGVSLVNWLCYYFAGELNMEGATWQQLLAGIIHFRFDSRFYFFAGDWFVWSLLLIRFLFGDIKYLSFMRDKRVYIPVAVIVVIYMLLEPSLIRPDADFLQYTFERAMPCLPFFCMGLYLRDIQWNPKDCPTPMIVLCLITAIVLPILTGTCDIFYNQYGRSYLLFLINAPLTTILFMYLFSFLSPSPYIKTLSNGTLIIMGTNQMILAILYILLTSSYRLLFPFIIMAVSYIPIVYLDKHFPILLGKWRRPRKSYLQQ